MVIIDTLRIHAVVQEWESLVERKRETYLPKDTFINIVNSMLSRKTVSISNANHPVVLASDGSPISIYDMASGEKQLFIILGETLLQENKSYVFLADEPELSLHVDWQLSLVPNIRKINDSAQIIFATHSPDIVGGYSDRVFDMEDILQ